MVVYNFTPPYPYGVKSYRIRITRLIKDTADGLSLIAEDRESTFKLERHRFQWLYDVKVPRKKNSKSVRLYPGLQYALGSNLYAVQCTVTDTSVSAGNATELSGVHAAIFSLTQPIIAAPFVPQSQPRKKLIITGTQPAMQ